MEQEHIYVQVSVNEARRRTVGPEVSAVGGAEAGSAPNPVKTLETRKL